MRADTNLNFKASLILFLIALPFFILSGVFYYTGEESLNWIETDCLIISSEMRSQVRDSKSGSHISYYPEILYSYTVGGEVFSGNNYSFQMSYGYQKTLSILAKYPVGETAIGYYNPDNPKESVIVPGSDNSAVLSFLLIALFFAAIALVTVVANILYSIRN